MVKLSSGSSEDRLSSFFFGALPFFLLTICCFIFPFTWFLGSITLVSFVYLVLHVRFMCLYHELYLESEILYLKAPFGAEVKLERDFTIESRGMGSSAFSFFVIKYDDKSYKIKLLGKNVLSRFNNDDLLDKKVKEINEKANVRVLVSS